MMQRILILGLAQFVSLQRRGEKTSIVRTLPDVYDALEGVLS